MINNIRRKTANLISPDKQESYPLVELNWMTPEREIEKALENHHMNFERDHGREAESDEEATNYVKQKTAELMKKLED